MKLTFGGEKSTGENYSDRTKHKLGDVAREYKKRKGKIEKGKVKGEKGKEGKRKRKRKGTREKRGKKECCFFIDQICSSACHFK